MNKDSRSLIEFLQKFRKGDILTEADINGFVWVVVNLEGRLRAGRKRVFNSASERWKFHNDKRKKEAK